jgi:hypothetical protein
MVAMMKSVVLLVVSLTACMTPDRPSARELPACEVSISRTDGIVISVDVTASCDSTDWNLEYRLFSTTLATTNRRDNPCGSTTHVEFLNMPGLADLKAFGWIYSASQRVECAVTGGDGQ